MIPAFHIGMSVGSVGQRVGAANVDIQLAELPQVLWRQQDL
ncbi:hypothetical protein [Komagataeibacter intermedius]|nr:hypothetical protein [Komagataeibacter intermedius]